jgi:hypothetical protein
MGKAKQHRIRTQKELEEGDLLAVLSKRYPDPEWAFLVQVRNGTGYSRTTRTADAIALNCYPSRGMELHGFEVKVTRSDWLRELAKPDKSESIQSYCDRWWIVVPEGIVKEGELPPTWGLLELPDGKTKLKLTVDAPKLEAKPLDRSFVASVLRSAARTEVSDPMLERARAEGYEQAKEAAERYGNRRLETKKAELDRLQREVAEFERRSGVKIRGWHRKHIGDAVKVVVDDLDSGLLRKRLEQAIQEFRYTEQVISRALAELESTECQTNQKTSSSTRS